MDKLALSIITKDNEATLPRLLASVAAHVDAIFITDTGSTDKTLDIAKEYGAIVSHFDWVDDFSAARNYAFSQIPEEYQYVIWLDSDDELIEGENLRPIITQMGLQELTAVYFTYNYTIDPETKQVLVEHSRERIVRRGLYEWKARIHEVLIPLGRQNAVYSPLVKVNHWPEGVLEVPNMERNVRILEKELTDQGENPDPRTQYYLGRAYFDLEKYEAASTLFQDYLDRSGWDEERAQAWNYMGEIAKNSGDLETAIDCYLTAAKERPDYPTWYINLGLAHAMAGKHEQALFWVKQALNIPAKDKTAMVVNPRDDMARALETIFISGYATGKLDEAWAAAKKLTELFPTNEVFSERLDGLEKLRRWGTMTEVAVDIAKELKELKEDHKLEPFLNSLPAPIQGNSLMQQLKNEILPPKVWPKKSIAYFCGKGFEQWDPNSLKKGIGGSETAVIYLAKEWTKLGYQVTVFGNPKKEETYDGVEYKYYWRFNQADTFDILIAWRNETVYRLPIKARKKLLDLHDVVSSADYVPDLVDNIDAIMVKSHYHRSYLPDLADEKFKVVSNGIEIEDGKKAQREPYLLSWVSSYDRGLQYLLDMWPKIKVAVPKAKLEIAYGWDIFDKAMGGNPERQAWKKKMQEKMQQDGVTHRGRISKKELHRLHQRASIMAYYCIFEEINCISVLEAQGNGSLPVTTDFAALKETNEFGLKVPGDPYDKETRVKYADALIATLQKKLIQNSSEAMVEGMKKEYSWPVIAKAWAEVFGD